MKIQLPLETWMEVLDWLRRHELVNMLEQLWDRELTPIVQLWLHWWRRNVRIGKLEFAKEWPYVDNRAGLFNWNLQAVPIAAVELPRNISDFSKIQLRYMDRDVLAFLAKLQPMFRSVHLEVHPFLNNFDAILTAFGHLLPLLSGPIASITTGECMVPKLHANFPAAFYGTKCLKISWITVQSTELLANWLFTPLADAQPRVLLIEFTEDFVHFFDSIQQLFMDPARTFPSPFVVRFAQQFDVPAQALVTENGQTSEQLVVHRGSGDNSSTLVTNCGSSAEASSGEWLAEWERNWDKQAGKQKRQIGQLCRAIGDVRLNV